MEKPGPQEWWRQPMSQQLLSTQLVPHLRGQQLTITGNLNKIQTKPTINFRKWRRFVHGEDKVEAEEVVAPHLEAEGVVEVEASTTPTEDQVRVVKVPMDKPTDQVPTPGTPD